MLDQRKHSLFSLVQRNKGKPKVVGSLVAYLREEMNAYGMEMLPIRYDHILQLESLPHHHSDPFDRLLIAQTMSESLPILWYSAFVLRAEGPFHTSLGRSPR
ncbi:MAG TPA: hypothetical protein VFE38_09210 [Edaphobacter sp.]|nr:hypothetical protein [Edaphobacter sp.]